MGPRVVGIDYRVLELERQPVLMLVLLRGSNSHPVVVVRLLILIDTSRQPPTSAGLYFVDMAKRAGN